MVILRPMWICRILNIDIRKAELSLCNQLQNVIEETLGNEEWLMWAQGVIEKGFTCFDLLLTRHILKHIFICMVVMWLSTWTQSLQM